MGPKRVRNSVDEGTDIALCVLWEETDERIVPLVPLLPLGPGYPGRPFSPLGPHRPNGPRVPGGPKFQSMENYVNGWETGKTELRLRSPRLGNPWVQGPGHTFTSGVTTGKRQSSRTPRTGFELGLTIK